jgi:hypothetical protein
MISLYFREGHSMKPLIVAAAAFLLSGNLAAQTYKCVDAAGKVTYTGSKCSELRLKDGGQVKETLQVAPGDRAAAKAARAPAKPAPPKPVTRTAEAPPAKPAKAEGEDRRCFTVKTAKGTATRCGDKQEE